MVFKKPIQSGGLPKNGGALTVYQRGGLGKKDWVGFFDAWGGFDTPMHTIVGAKRLRKIEFEENEINILANKGMEQDNLICM